MKKLYLISFLIICVFISANAQKKLFTIAESSNYKSTSTYNDVIDFINTLDNTADNLRIEYFATSTEGRDIPLMIIGSPLPEKPENLINDDRVIVYIQANIHAGEVEGKEAVLMLARDLLGGKDDEVLENVVLLICPIFNPDGNEKFSLKNRTNQNGPINGVGIRYNGQMLDINRDAMKVETPEMKGVITQILNKWDPDVSVDCHTTNGSFHEEPITFTWMNNPNTDRSLINFMRDNMMPKVSKTLHEIYNVENIFYGEFVDRLNYERGWISYAAEPRYLVNYIGVRNRLSILNENYVYADFKTRVWGCYYLLKSILEFSSDNYTEISQLLEQADQHTISKATDISVIDSFAIEYSGKPTPEKITIKAFETDTIPGVKGYWRYKKSDRKVTVTIPYIADYFSTKSVRFPYAYILSIPDKDVLNLLKTHGIKIEQLSENKTINVERFKIEELKPSNRINQGHYTNRVKGKFIEETKEFPSGTYFVKTTQKLGNLAAYLLEPQADDGLLKWNYFDKFLVPQWGSGYFPYPVYRVIEETEL